jgi:alkylhydroperoxidase/carboxymuconolactone decarboxylase family protein YurZ
MFSHVCVYCTPLHVRRNLSAFLGTTVSAAVSAAVVVVVGAVAAAAAVAAAVAVATAQTWNNACKRRGM